MTVYLIGPGDEIDSKIVTINVTSRTKKPWSKAFSPFYLGPVSVTPFNEKELVSKNFENAWQYCKVYQEYEQENKFRKWFLKGIKNPKAVRFPMGRGAKPLYSLWKGKHLQYVEARFRIYAPLYAWCIENYAQEEFQRLKNLLTKHHKIALFDFDGYDYLRAGFTLEQVMYNHSMKMGHGFVLAMMLTNNRVWEEDFDENKIFHTIVGKSKIGKKLFKMNEDDELNSIEKENENEKEKEKENEKENEKEKEKEK
ncbi:hypothetical protein M0812_02763 [Anaeramoeba flamelloides]|uniref:Uncharacterized protein n=1 Tax=Anaeramoeba flamelloides TaxID=1746091 RepID=A0AAV7YTA7_9EUKA|nr:hypothetical protein M0812_02763 [Anaeramoeba flamelloides]